MEEDECDTERVNSEKKDPENELVLKSGATSVTYSWFNERRPENHNVTLLIMPQIGPNNTLQKILR